MSEETKEKSTLNLSTISIILGIVGMIIGSAFGASTYIDSRVNKMIDEHSRYPHRGVSASIESLEALKERVDYLEKIVHRLEFDEKKKR